MASPSFVFAEDFASPYFLHHGDNLGTLLISQLFTGENYHTRIRSMVMALIAKNKIEFIDGTVAKPSDVSNPLHNAWIRCNTMVLSWILNSLSNEIAASVIYLNTAQDVWLDLKDRFLQSNFRRQYLLLLKIITLPDNQTLPSQLPDIVLPVPVPDSISSSTDPTSNIDINIHSPPAPHNSFILPLRQSTRLHRTLGYLQGYHCQKVSLYTPSSNSMGDGPPQSGWKWKTRHPPSMPNVRNTRMRIDVNKCSCGRNINKVALCGLIGVRIVDIENA
ncbi:hypothetical protein F0562_010556 [Nyssa sinensis]|uniref:Retrotransposon Copia-like N-terminal domain-containing protein n=1 Tax=Nyssa sinensis TaxID=561372 RepID=A0A5J4ZYW2_9ASTE|nr:hypothetical protein F0562_010556 [Nyssa sinensis]